MENKSKETEKGCNHWWRSRKFVQKKSRGACHKPQQRMCSQQILAEKNQCKNIMWTLQFPHFPTAWEDERREKENRSTLANCSTGRSGTFQAPHQLTPRRPWQHWCTTGLLAQESPECHWLHPTKCVGVDCGGRWLQVLLMMAIDVRRVCVVFDRDWSLLIYMVR